jgi:hypothetical protein
MRWIDLFPFSDDPERVHEAIAMLHEQHRRPHALRRLLEVLPQSPATSALATLKRLAADNPTFLQEFEWLNAGSSRLRHPRIEHCEVTRRRLRRLAPAPS